MDAAQYSPFLERTNNLLCIHTRLGVHIRSYVSDSSRKIYLKVMEDRVGEAWVLFVPFSLLPIPEIIYFRKCVAAEEPR